ncbi:MAG: PucR family transcriptional regulator [Sarcina sp.]|nr:PucR family transcriptional regulator [Sarcina sp.]
MGFTIEDMLVVSADRYQMKMVAGQGGWSNSISWVLMLEERTIIRHFTGKELVVTTGLGFQDEGGLDRLARDLVQYNAAGLIVNTGFYIHEIPASVRCFCDENDLPLLTVPWEVVLTDLIKDFSIRIFLQSSTDEQISSALVHAIEDPLARDLYEGELLQHFDLDGIFQIALVTTGDLDSMDTVDRRRLSYRMQLYLTNLTHNGHFFYYDSCFVIVMNAVPEKESAEILQDFSLRARRKMPDRPLFIGVSDSVQDIGNLHFAYRRAKAAVSMAMAGDERILFFADMGINRILYMIEDKGLLRDLSDRPLRPLLESDRLHGTEYVETLRIFLQCGGSIKTMAEKLFIHRNTILYRMAKIRELLGCTLESPQERMEYMIACLIREMPEAGLWDREHPES